MNCLSASHPLTNLDWSSYIPDIPDFYFNQENALRFRVDQNRTNLSASESGNTYIFGIRDNLIPGCSGTVKSIRYCYQDKTTDLGQTKTIFNFLTLSRSRAGPLLMLRSEVQSVQLSSKCSIRAESQSKICCDTTILSNKNHMLNSEATLFGVETPEDTSMLLLLVFNSMTEYDVVLTQYVTGNDPGSRMMGPLLLLRLYIGNFTYFINARVPVRIVTPLVIKTHQ